MQPNSSFRVPNAFIIIALSCLTLFPQFALALSPRESLPEGTFTCGNELYSDLEPNLGLAKSSQLPAPVKVRKGKLKALILRVSFSDAPYSVDTGTIGKTNLTINTLYASMSRNTFQWEFLLHPRVLNAPGTKALYAANFSSLQTWIAGQITATGLKRGIDYDVYIASFPTLPLEWAGLSNMRDGNWINGNYSSIVTAHELGHSLGLPHAHSIEAGEDMLGVPGNDANTNEYGNPYDVMGHGGSTSHFNVLAKLQLGWHDSDEIQEINSSGIYRIYAHDNSVHKSKLIGIRIPSTNPNYAYWFEYRTLSTSARAGATVLFQGFKSSTSLATWYLDTTPDSRSNSDENDGVLVPGSQFSDKYGALTFKTLALNANTWDENGWVDLQVSRTQPPTIGPITGLKEPWVQAKMGENIGSGIDLSLSLLDLRGRSLVSNSSQVGVLRTRSGKLSLALNPDPTLQVR